MDWSAVFSEALPYAAFLDRHATPEQRRRWDAMHGRVRLTAEQVDLLRGFRRQMPVLVLNGAWCGDCVNQCPIFDHFACVSPAIDLRFLDRDARPDVRAALNAVRDEPGDPYDGVIVDYVDVMTGGPIQKTQNFSMQLLRPGEHTMSHRHSNGGVYVCIEGSGHTIINGEEFAWAENDVFCVPSMHWHEHVNGSDKEDAVLYCVSDAPALEKLGLLWEERKTATGEIVAIGNALPS